jgi:hypothetical protein
MWIFGGDAAPLIMERIRKSMSCYRGGNQFLKFYIDASIITDPAFSPTRSFNAYSNSLAAIIR